MKQKSVNQPKQTQTPNITTQPIKPLNQNTSQKQREEEKISQNNTDKRHASG